MKGVWWHDFGVDGAKVEEGVEEVLIRAGVL